MKRHFLLLCLLFVAVTAAAQVTTSTLGGRITDENGPIDGVTVVLINQTTNQQYSATSRDGGWYQIHNVVPGGPFTLRIYYFGYEPMTLRSLYLFAGQNTVVDVNLETRETHTYGNEASTMMLLGEVLGQPMTGGQVAFSPLTYNMVAQRVYSEVPFDVRQEATLEGVSRIEIIQAGSNKFHGSAYGFYNGGSIGATTPGTSTAVGGLNVSTPLWSEDYQLFAGLQYTGILAEGAAAPSESGGLFGLKGLAGAARMDARLSESFHLDLSGGQLSPTNAWASTGLTTSLGENLSMRLQAGWYNTGVQRTLLASDDFTCSAGRHQVLFGVQFAHANFPANDSTYNQGNFYVQDVVRFGRRVTVLAGIRFSLPFTFSPRASVRYDILGTGKLVLRAGTAVYGKRGASTWKNLAAVDVGLPAKISLSMEALYGQVVEKLFYIKQGNLLESYYSFTGRLQRPFVDNLWSAVSYTYSSGAKQHDVTTGVSYKAIYGNERFGTTISALYTGGYYVDPVSASGFKPGWNHGLQVRLTQGFTFSSGNRDHSLQITAFYTLTSAASELLVGLRYLM